MAAKGAKYLPTLTAVEAYAGYFHGYKLGQSPATPEMQEALRTFKFTLDNHVRMASFARRCCASSRGGVAAHPYVGKRIQKNSEEGC